MTPAPLVPSPRSPSRSSEDLTAVRAWARSVGFPVDERRSVPISVLRTYRRVHAV